MSTLILQQQRGGVGGTRTWKSTESKCCFPAPVWCEYITAFHFWEAVKVRIFLFQTEDSLQVFASVLYLCAYLNTTCIYISTLHKKTYKYHKFK